MTQAHHGFDIRLCHDIKVGLASNHQSIMKQVHRKMFHAARLANGNSTINKLAFALDSELD